MSFYAGALSDAEQALLAQAPSTSELSDEIALVRARIACLSDRPADRRHLTQLLLVLVRLIGVQNRLGGLDTDIAELNEEVRREIMGEIPSPAPADEG